MAKLSEITQSAIQENKKAETVEEQLKDIEDRVRSSHTHLIGVQEGKERENRSEAAI